ncbi:MAG: ribonuclease HII [Candidatus Omnitrophota bacterium]|nr:ribonuclease HII [Candidatus Omnitrophota bacterium]
MQYYEKKVKKMGYRLIAGVDEAGRGPLAGPVVASAVILRKTIKGINDSKKLSPAKRYRLFLKIISTSIVGISVVNERIIDRINILNATLKAMEKAIFNLTVAPDYLLIDGPSAPLTPYPALRLIKGDQKSCSIAAASIVAKVIRDKIMMLFDKSYPQYGFCFHKGYPTRRHITSLNKYGPSPIHRYSFRPVKELKYD